MTDREEGSEPKLWELAMMWAVFAVSVVIAVISFRRGDLLWGVAFAAMAALCAALLSGAHAQRRRRRR